MTYTGRDLDIAIAGEGWMQVLTPAGEEVPLSRRGDLRIDMTGHWSTRSTKPNSG